MATTQDIVRATVDIVERYKLDDIQTDGLSNSAQLDNIVRSATYGRWDQVTLMLIQDKIIEKWPM